MDPCSRESGNGELATYKGSPCRSAEMTIGDTVFTVISVQSDKAREAAYDKVKKLILNHMPSEDNFPQ